MGTSGTRGAVRWRFLRGALLLGAGTLACTFGAVAWLASLFAPSAFALVSTGIFLGFLPAIAGVALVWAGLDGLEDFDDGPRARAIVAAAGRGGTCEEIAARLGERDVRDVERRLDRLVVCDKLALELTDDGRLVYARQTPG